RAVGPGAPVIAFAVSIAIGAGILAGIAPVLQLSGAPLRPFLQEESRGSASRERRRPRSLLVLGPGALAFVLLTGAGMVTQSLWRMQKVDPGFDPHQLLTAQLILPDAHYPDDARAAAVVHRMLDEISALPGVRGAAATSTLPLGQGGNTIRFVVPGGRRQASGLDWEANIRSISPNYFDVMRVRPQSGRAFTRSDDDKRSPVVVVNRTLADRVFPGESAVGRSLTFTFAKNQPPREIVGVVADERQAGLDAPATPTLYLPLDQDAMS